MITPERICNRFRVQLVLVSTHEVVGTECVFNASGPLVQNSAGDVTLNRQQQSLLCGEFMETANQVDTRHTHPQSVSKKSCCFR